MKEKGTRAVGRRGETTRDERIKVITLRDEAGLTWAQIGQKLNIDRRTVQKVSCSPSKKKTNNITGMGSD